MSSATPTCLVCGKGIEPERLVVAPKTDFCAEHALARPCQESGCGNEVEAERIEAFPETYYCATHAPKDRGCEVCQRPIEYQRREAVPESRLCDEHAAAAVKHGGEFKRVVKQVNLGKTGISGGKSRDIETEREVNREVIDKVREEYLKSQGYEDL